MYSLVVCFTHTHTHIYTYTHTHRQMWRTESLIARSDMSWGLLEASASKLNISQCDLEPTENLQFDYPESVR